MALRLLLVLALVVPIATLFGLVWRSTEDGTRFATLERHGVSYVGTLVSVELALAESQSAVLTGRPVSTEKLTRAIDAAEASDARYGDELRTHERWADVRAKIEALPSRNGDLAAASSAYAETADLLLALIEKVRSNSRLIRDPEADTYYLQDAAVQELPESIVSANRLVHLALLTAQHPDGADQNTGLADLMSLRAALDSNATDLADDVRQAVDTTGSRTLGGNLLSPLDRFRQAIDALMPPPTPMGERPSAAGSASIVQAGEEAHAAAGVLSNAMLAEIDSLLVVRLDALADRRNLAIGAMAIAVLLAVIPPVVTLVRDCRRPTGRCDPPRGAPSTSAHAEFVAAAALERSGAPR